jgi:hypothetical protein
MKGGSGLKGDLGLKAGLRLEFQFPLFKGVRGIGSKLLSSTFQTPS